MSDEAAVGQTEAKPQTHGSGYQEMLRNLGRWLDWRGAQEFSVTETPEAFTVLLEHEAGVHDVEEYTFPPELLLLQTESKGKRGSPVPQEEEELKTAMKRGPAEEARGFSDFLRALGYELDQAQAKGIVLATIDKDFLLTYNFLDPRRGFSWRKRWQTLDPAQSAKLIEAAHARRRPSPVSGWSSLFKRRR